MVDKGDEPVIPAMSASGKIQANTWFYARSLPSGIFERACDSRTADISQKSSYWAV
jgi:hypothetical protein